MCYVKYLFAPQKVVKRLGFKYVGMCCKKSGGLLLCNDRSGAETTGSFSAHTATYSTSESGARGSGNLCSARTEVERRPTRYKAFLPNYGNNNTHSPLNLPSPIYQP